MDDVKLYTVTSTVAEYDGHKDVVFNWFVNRRREPAYPFTEEVSRYGFRLPQRLAGPLVDLPDAYTSEDYWYPEDALNQMFALDEAEMLAEYLRVHYGDEPAIREQELPIECGRMGPGFLPIGGPQDHYMLDKTPGYTLSFEVHGYYDLRHAEGPYSVHAEPDEVERYARPAPYAGEVRDLLNDLDGERQQIAHALGTEHPLFKLVDGALRSADIDELRTARAAADGWLSTGGEFDF